MRDFAAELRGLAAEPVSSTGAGEDRQALADLMRLLEPSISSEQLRQRRIQHFRDHHGMAISEGLWPMQIRVREIQPRTETGSHLAEITTLGWRTITEETGSEEVLDRLRFGYLAFGPENQPWNLTGGVAAELLGNGTMRLLGVHAVYRGYGNGYRPVFKIERSAPVLTVLADQAVAEVVSAVNAQVGAALVAWRDQLSASSPRS